MAGDALSAWCAAELSKTAKAEGASALSLEAAERAKEALGVVGGGAPAAPAQFELPDGKKIKVSAEQRAAIAEPLFDPTLVGEAGGGLAQLVADSIRARDRDGVLQSVEMGKDGTSNWYRNIVVAGGTSLLPNLQQRLVNELSVRAPAGCVPEVHAPKERAYGAWLGGSILASLGSMGQMWISKQEYDENGPLIVNRKCF